jgi:hypothetical protein
MGVLDVSQQYGNPMPVVGIALPFLSYVAKGLRDLHSELRTWTAVVVE